MEPRIVTIQAEHRPGDDEDASCDARITILNIPPDMVVLLSEILMETAKAVLGQTGKIVELDRREGDETTH